MAARRSTSTKVAKAPKPKKPRAWSEQARPLGEHPSSSTGSPSAAAHASGGLSVVELRGSEGLGSVLLELVGEGTISIGHALDAWQREQERVSNRAWRRPGGLQRMGGL